MQKNNRPTMLINPPQAPALTMATPPAELKPINLALNESPFPASPQAVKAAEEIISTKSNRYPDPFSNELRNKLAEIWSLEAARLVCGNGSEELLDVIARLFVGVGDKVIISQSGFFQFARTARRLNADIIYAPENEYQTDIAALLQLVDSNTKLIFLAIPNNPTGVVLPLADIKNLYAKLPKHVILVLDCAYGEYMDKDILQGITDICRNSENAIMTRTFSKAFALASLRIGWCYAPEWMCSGLNFIRGVGNVNAAGQKAALAALGDIDYMWDMGEKIAAGRETLAENLDNLGLNYIRGFGNFLLTQFPDIAGKRGEDLRPLLLQQAGIILRPVPEPGFANWSRFGIGTPEEMQLFMQTLQKLL